MIKSPQQGAIEGVDFIKNHIIETTSKRFDDFAGINKMYLLMEKQHNRGQDGARGKNNVYNK